jgi:ribose transport system ATP-binding protein
MSSLSFASGRAEPSAADVPTIEFRNISKRFGSIQALSDVSFAGRAGSVHAITGENGAGKSTLMKLLAGVFSPDSGEIRLEGLATAFESASSAREAGVSTVFQELTLLPNLTIAENLFLGREPQRFGLIDRAEMRRRTREALDRIGIDFDAEASCGELVIAEQHLIEIAKGAAANSPIIIYDEPTAALDARGVDKLVGLIEAQKAAGKLIFYISHRLDEIFRLCDTTTVLKDGRHVTTCPTAGLTRDSLVSLMVGRELSQFFPPRPAAPARSNIALGVSDYVAGPGRKGVSFQLNRNEIVGLTGLEGQGQRDVIRALAGLLPAARGVAKKYDREGGAKTLPASVVAAVRAGVGFVPEDRKSEGLYLPLSIAENIGIGMFRGASMISGARVDRGRVRGLMQAMQVRARDESQPVSSLSGGNQQKVMIGRWLASGIDILLIEEPTRGVDVGAKSEIYKLLREFADKGGAVLITSSELTEHIGLCDRILVMREHEIVAELAATAASEEAIMRHALMGRAPAEAVS